MVCRYVLYSYIQFSYWFIKFEVWWFLTERCKDTIQIIVMEQEASTVSTGIDVSVETKLCAICIEEIEITDACNASNASNDSNAFNVVTSEHMSNVCTLKCGHEFHLSCITPVIVNSFLARKDVICPMCRNVECSTSNLTYQSAYNSLIDLVRSEGRDELLSDVRIDIEQLENLSSARNIPSRQRSMAFTEYTSLMRDGLKYVWCGNITFLVLGLIIIIVVFVRKSAP